MTKEQSINQLKGHWARVVLTELSQRVLFERLYDCFEVIGKLESGLVGGRMIVALKKQFSKNQPNEIRAVFGRMLGNEDFLNDLSCLKTYSPIQNDTHNNNEVIIVDEKDFNTIINVIYMVRCNLRHGQKEYNTRNEQIIRVTNRIFYKLVGGARLKYLS